METDAPFDFVIVGAGSAGCVLAHRLSASGRDRVLLLEAGGPDKDNNIHIPAGFPKLYHGPSDWDFRTEPQAHLNGRRLYQPRGKTLGGSSSMNAMIYVRGHRDDYDGWAERGADGWDWASVRPYFHKSEGQGRHRSEHHGTDGPLTVSDLRAPSSLSLEFIEAAEELGFPRNDDFNADALEGFGLYQVTQRGGARCSAAKAFLEPARARPNLAVETGALVHRIVIEGGRAVGVEYERGGETRTARAGREIILSAGAFGSPHVLLRSGVGPGEHLRAHGVPVVADLPGVGENLQDHLAVGVTFRTGFRGTLDVAESLLKLGPNLFQYLVRKTGPFSSNVGEAGGFVRSAPHLGAPDVQYHFAPCFFLEHGFRNPKGEAGYTVAGLVLTPESRGTVRLKSADPREAPAIDPNYLSDPGGEDLRRTVHAVRLAQRLGGARAFAAHRKGPYEPERVLETDAEVEAFVRAHAETLYHPVGTCPMGDGPRAVLDARLCVRGVQGLRVADASVMPTVTRGNTNAPTIMIAEKAADLILSREPALA